MFTIVFSPIFHMGLFYWWKRMVKYALIRRRNLIFRAGYSLIGCLSEVLIFNKKWANGRFTKKNKRLVHSLIFGERPEQITHGHSFLVSDLSDSLTSLIKKEEMSESLIKNVQKTYQTYDFTILVALLTWATWAIGSVTVGHLSGAIWANRSQSLIWFERS